MEDKEFAKHIDPSKVQIMPTRGLHRYAYVREGSTRYLLKGLRPNLADNFDYLDILNSEYEFLNNADSPAMPNAIRLVDDSPIGPAILEDAFEGSPLNLLYSKQYSSFEMRKMFDGLCRSLQTLHAKGMAHGNLHPQNVFIRTSTDPMLVEPALPDCEAYCENFAMNGKSKYTPPEYANGLNPTPQGDVYSLGQILIDLGFSKACAGPIKRCLDPDPAKRYPDAITLGLHLQKRHKLKRLARLMIIGLIAVAIAAITLLIAWVKPLPSNKWAANTPTEQVDY